MKDSFEFDSQIGQFGDAPVGLNMHYFPVPKSVVSKFKSSLPVRFVVVLQGEKWHGAVMPKGDGKGFVMVNKALLKKMNLVIGSKVKVRLEPETSPYGMPVCDELAEVLDQDPEASERFHSLTPGKQRNIIHYVGKIKSSQLRIDKSLMYLENLKQLPRGKEEVGRILGMKKD